MVCRVPCLNLLVLVTIWSVHGFQGLEMVSYQWILWLSVVIIGFLWLAQAVHGLQGLEMVRRLPVYFMIIMVISG